MLQRLIGTARRAMSSRGGGAMRGPPTGAGPSRRGGSSSLAGGLKGAVRGFMRGRRRGAL